MLEKRLLARQNERDGFSSDQHIDMRLTRGHPPQTGLPSYHSITQLTVSFTHRLTRGKTPSFCRSLAAMCQGPEYIRSADPMYLSRMY